MARFSQSQLEVKKVEGRFDREQTESALAALEGREDREAAAERKFLERRLARLDEDDRRRGELDGASREEILAAISRSSSSSRSRSDGTILARIPR
jgi:hypothetical protein